MAYVWPDPKSTRLEEGKGLRFVLPSVVQETVPGPEDGDPNEYMYHDVDEFSVGGLNRPTPGD